MRKKILILSALLAAAGVAVISCVKDYPPGVEKAKEPHAFTVEEAKAFFENTAADLTLWRDAVRNTDTTEPATRSAADGWTLVPQWDRAVLRSDALYPAVEVPVLTGNGLMTSVLRLRQGKKPNHKMEEAYARLVVRYIPQLDTMEYVLATFIPDKKFGEDLRNRIEDVPFIPRSGNFSGMVVYTTVEGKFLAGRKYVDGKWTHRMRPHRHAERDAVHSASKEYVQMIFVGKQPRTRGYGNDEFWCSVCQQYHDETWGSCQELDPIEVVYCSGCGQRIEFCYCDLICPECHFMNCICGKGEGEAEPDPDPDPEPYPGEGGGGGVPAEPRPTKWEPDCSGNANSVRQAAGSWLGQVKSTQATTIGNNAYISYSQFLAAVSASPGLEHSTTFVDWGEAKALTPITTGTSTSVETDFSSTMASGSVHNHPNGSPPSATDVIFTGSVVSEREHYTSTAVYDHGTGNYYVICVLDRTKAAAFSQKYGDQVDPQTNWFKDGSEIRNSLDDKDDFNRLSSQEKQAFQLADVLAKFDTGMRLVRIRADGGTETYGAKLEPGNKYKTPTKCTD